MTCTLLPPATKLGQGYVFTGVCDSVHRGRLPQCMTGIPPPWEQTPPLGADPPGSRRPPGSRQPPGAEPPQEQAPPRSRASPGADTPLGADTPQYHAGRYGQRAGGTHPTGM